jgi:hypothetical protein
MRFLYPGLLYWLVLGSIPIIVYYLMRFRSKRMAWGADYILERALARRRKKLYLDQILLLALRALVVMALVVAFARPQSRKESGSIGGDRVLRILLVDGSYSMLAGDGAQSRRDAALDTMRALVSKWERGSPWSLYMLDSQPDWVVDRKDVIDAEHSRAIIDKLKGEETSVSLASGLKTVLGHGAGLPREIYIFADDQATSWDGVDRVLAGLDANIRIYWICPPLANRRNLAVTELELGHERALRGMSFPVYARVRNFSREWVRDAELTLLVDGKNAGTERVSMPPGQSVSVRLELRLDEVGPHQVTARLSTDALVYDNAMSAGLEVAEAVTVLVLRDANRTDKFDSAAAFLKLAARVLGGGEGTNTVAGPLQVSEHAEPECPLSALTAYDAVVLDGGRTLSPELAATLRQYVDQGGGLVLAADWPKDSAVGLSEWSQTLKHVGLLPAAPVRLRDEPLGGDVYRRLSRSGFDRPALRDLETGADGDVAQVKFYSWVDFAQPEPDTEILARFSDGSPYVFRRRFERGNVLLLAAGLSSRNNNLLVRETVYPFLLHLFAEAASAGQYPRHVPRNAPVRYLAKGQPPPSAAQFNLAGEAPLTATLMPQPQGMRIEYVAGSPRVGPASLLVLRESGSETIPIGIHGEWMDSDLTAMTSVYRARLAEQSKWVEVTSTQELMEKLESEGNGSERYAWVLMAVLLLAAGELLMGLRFI